MLSPEPVQVVSPVSAPPDATGEQPTAAAIEGVAPKPMPNDIAAPKTIGSIATRARERLMLDVLFRRLLRRVSSTDRCAMVIYPACSAARERRSVDDNSKKPLRRGPLPVPQWR